MSGGAPHRRPRGPLRVLPPYHRPTLLTEFRVTSSERGFNRMKLIETPRTTLLRTKRASPERDTRQHAVRWPVALLFVPPHAPLPLRRRHESPTEYPGEGRTREGRLPRNEGFLGPGGMRKRFALATLRLPSQVETSTGGRYFVRRASHPR